MSGEDDFAWNVASGSATTLVLRLPSWEANWLQHRETAVTFVEVKDAGGICADP